MVNAIANSNPSAVSPGLPPSPASSFLDPDPSASGTPTFADVVHSALSKPSAGTNQSSTINPQANPPRPSQPVPPSATSPPIAGAPPMPAKRISKLQDTSATLLPQNSSVLTNQSLSAPLVFAAVTLPAVAPPNVALPNIALQNIASSDDAPPNSVNSNVLSSPAAPSATANSSGAQNDIAFSNPQFAATPSPQVPPAAAAFVSLLETPATQDSPTHPNTLATTSSNDAVPSPEAITAPEVTTTGSLLPQLTISVDAAVTTNFASNTPRASRPSAAPAALVPNASSTPIAPSQSAAPAGRIVQTSSSVAANHGQPLSSILQQFQELLANDGDSRLPSSGVVELSRPDVQPKAPAADHFALLPAPDCVSTLASTVNANLSKSFQGAPSGIYSSQAAPSPALSAPASSRSMPQNSFSDSNEQNDSDSTDASNSPDSPPTNSQVAKSSAANLSDALAASATSRPNAPQPTPALSPAISPILITPPPAESSSHLAATETLPSAPAQAAPPLPPLHPPDTTGGRFVNDAGLSDAANQSELRIALQTDKLGAIELRAHVVGDEVGAAIVVEKRDAHAALAVELPALQQTLSEKQLRVDQVILTQGSLHSPAGDTGANAQQGQRGGGNQASRQAPVYTSENVGLQRAAWFVPEVVGIFDSQGRLSVQA